MRHNRLRPDDFFYMGAFFLGGGIDEINVKNFLSKNDKNKSGRQSIKNEISGRLGVIGIQMCIGFLFRF